MTEKNNSGWKWCLLFLIAYTIALYFYSSYKISQIEPIEIEKIDTLVVSDTIFKRDTLTITKPIPTYIQTIKTDTVYTEKGDTIQLLTENKIYKDTICYQSDSIILESSIIGINPQLDYIKADWRRQEITNTITIEKYVRKKGLRITPQVGLGYGLLNKQTDVFIGIGLSYNF